MIHGTGIDIVKIDRLKKSVENSGPRFLERVFTKAEVEFCRQRKDPYPCLAARFAAKEAFIKALSADTFIALADIQIVADDKGKPYFNRGGRLGEILASYGITEAHLSLTHEKDYAAANVVMEKV